MKTDPEIWKCLGIGLLVWVAACTSLLFGRAEYSLGAENRRENHREEVILSRVVTEDGEYLMTDDLLITRP